MKELRNTPWTIDRNDRIHDSIGRTVADCRYATAQGQPIIAAVNCHAKLLEAAKYSLKVGYGADECGDHCMNSCHWCQLRAIIAEAEGAQ